MVSFDIENSNCDHRSFLNTELHFSIISRVKSFVKISCKNSRMALRLKFRSVRAERILLVNGNCSTFKICLSRVGSEIQHVVEGMPRGVVFRTQSYCDLLSHVKTVANVEAFPCVGSCRTRLVLENHKKNEKNFFSISITFNAIRAANSMCFYS